jgi:alpha-beta hydrolase superfamily lysophospholipase
MEHYEGTFNGSGGINLYYQSWHSDSSARGVVVMVHGLGGYGDLFAPAVHYLLSQNHDVYAFDLRGHGHSPGQRGHIHAWSEFREDLHAFLHHINQQRETYSCPYFLWGHSLGGTIALDYALRSPQLLKGLIVTAPALGKVCVPPFKLALGQLLSEVWPRFSLRLGIRNEVCIRNPEMCAVYLQDTRRHEYGTARLAKEFFATVDWINQHASDLQVPLLLLHCSTDQVTFPEASREFFQRLSFSDKQYFEYPTCYHDMLLADDQQILDDLGNWIDRHLEGATVGEPVSLF